MTEFSTDDSENNIIGFSLLFFNFSMDIKEIINKFANTIAIHFLKTFKSLQSLLTIWHDIFNVKLSLLRYIRLYLIWQNTVYSLCCSLMCNLISMLPFARWMPWPLQKTNMHQTLWFQASWQPFVVKINDVTYNIGASLHIGAALKLYKLPDQFKVISIIAIWSRLQAT